MCFDKFSNEELVLLASSLALALSQEFSKEELAIFATFFTSFADNLALLSL